MFLELVGEKGKPLVHTNAVVYTRIWKNDFRGLEASKTMSVRDQLRVDRKQLIRMQH